MVTRSQSARDNHRLIQQDSSPVAQSFTAQYSSPEAHAINPHSTESPLYQGSGRPFDSFSSGSQLSVPSYVSSTPTSSSLPLHASTEDSVDSLNPETKLRSLSSIYRELDDTAGDKLLADTLSISHGEPHQSHSYVAFVNTASMIEEPKTYAAAMKTNQAQKWTQAMNEEYDSLLKNHTWDLVDLPPGRFIVKNKWIYKCKPKADGSIDRYKARLVAKGYSQSYGIDYDETYAPVAKADNIRTLLSIAAAEDYELVQFDIKTTFLHGDLSEDIYMDQPLGFEHPNGKVCHLRKSLYGLKQANRC